MGYERFYQIFKIFMVLNPFLPGSGSVTNFFQILDSDSYQNDTDPPHCWYKSTVKYIYKFDLVYRKSGEITAQYCTQRGSNPGPFHAL